MKSGAAFFGMVGVGAVAFALGYQLGRNQPGVTPPPVAQKPTTPQPTKPDAPRPPAPQDNTVYKVPVRDAHCKGPADAKVTILEFSEFQCPFCTRVGPTLKQVVDTYGNDVRICFKHNPLPFHQDAPLAAQAALAAGAQGKFWEMHDKLFDNQKDLKRPNIETLAQGLGLDMNKFKADLDTSAYKSRIDADMAEAAQFGARGTPSFFINGKPLRGAQPFEAFKTAIDKALTDANAALAAGTSRGDLYAKLTEKGLAKAEAPPPQQQPPATRQAVTVSKTDTCKGPETAKVTIVEYSEFQCPFCSRVVPTMKQLMDAYPKDVRLCFRHNPLPFHKEAPLASEAALAAGDQGKFWQMHDKMFENQKDLTRPSLERYAQELGLDMAKFKASLDNNAHKGKIDEDMKSAAQFGARGTPAFFINGTPLSGAQPFESFKAAVDKELALADDLIKKGTPLAKVYEEALKLAPPAPAAPPPQPGAPDPNKVYNVQVGNSFAKGPASAPITIIVFSDFQCPFCSRVNPAIKQVEETYKDKVRVAFKHNPLPFHQDAPLASKAALAAGAQGKFWEMHDKLFANQQALKRDALVKYAEELGLNKAKFEKDMDDPKLDEQLKKDTAEAAANGASGTPTSFINGRQLVGAQPFDAFKKIIDEELAKKGK
jgi:protein-disulfide isomerase